MNLFKNASLSLLLTIFFLSGCGSNNQNFVVTNPQPNIQTTRPVVLQSVLPQPRTLDASIASVSVSGLDSNGARVYGPINAAILPSLTFDVPLNLSVFQVAYQTGNGTTVGVFQTLVPEGTNTFTINDPDYIDANDFVSSIAVAPGTATIDVGQTLPLTVTATLFDNSTVDVSQFATLASSNTGIVTASANNVVGAAPGSTTVTVTLFNVSTTATVNVNDFRRGLLSSTDGTTPGDRNSDTASISNDGRFVAFQSQADNLISGGNTDIRDIYVIDRVDGSIRILSNRSDGSPSQDDSRGPQISGNGRFVIFASDDSLTPNDTNNRDDVYLYDLQNSTLELISVNQAGTASGTADSEIYAGTITDDGRFVLFDSGAQDLVSGPTFNGDNVYLRDRQTNTTELISIGTGGIQANERSVSYQDGISSDGRYVTFHSTATNLDPQVTDNNGVDDVFLRDRQTDTTTLITRANGTTSSADGGSYVTDANDDLSTIIFVSRSLNLVSPALTNNPNTRNKIYRYTRATANVELLADDGQGGAFDGNCEEASISDDGRFLVFQSQDNPTFSPNVTQTLIRDLTTGEYRNLTATSNGGESNGTSYGYLAAMTPDGRTIVFESRATDLAAQAVNSTSSQVYAVLNPFL